MTTINSAQSALRDLIGLIPLKLREQAHDDITTIEQLISDYGHAVAGLAQIENISRRAIKQQQK